MCPRAMAETALTRNNLIKWIPGIIGKTGKIDMIGLGKGNSCAVSNSGVLDLSMGSFLLCDHYGPQWLAQRDCGCVILSE